jgi:hypothetical protein
MTWNAHRAATDRAPRLFRRRAGRGYQDMSGLNAARFTYAIPRSWLKPTSEVTVSR